MPGTVAREISEAVSRQIATMEYAPPFQMAHPQAFELANRLIELTPGDLDHVFFTNSGSESVDTALKIAIAYQRLRGEGTRQRLIGREKGYHGVGFGGISVGGMVNNRKFFGAMLPGVGSSAAHTRSRTQRVLARAARMGRASGRRSGTTGRAARCIDHRCGDRRARCGFSRRRVAAEGLSAATALDLRQVRHPADLR